MKLTKEYLLLEWCLKVGVFSSVHARKWGIGNFYSRADRTIREFVEKGNLRRLTEEEIILRQLREKDQAKVAWYETV